MRLLIITTRNFPVKIIVGGKAGLDLLVVIVLLLVEELFVGRELVIVWL